MKQDKPPTANQITAELLIRLPQDFPGLWVWRNNTGAVKMDKRFVRFGLPGAPDILGVAPPGGMLLGWEIKGPGDRQSNIQQAWAAKLRSVGGEYFLVEHIGWDCGKPNIGPVLEQLRALL